MIIEITMSFFSRISLTATFSSNTAGSVKLNGLKNEQSASCVHLTLRSRKNKSTLTETF